VWIPYAEWAGNSADARREVFSRWQGTFAADGELTQNGHYEQSNGRHAV
jgi:hypothetical protein